MKVISKKAFRARNLLVLAPLALIVIFLLATSGPVSVGAAFVPSAAVPPPGPFPPAPQPPNFDGYVDMTDLNGLLANDANRGTTHLIDVRSSFEVVADVCPMQVALMMPVYPTTNTGHPVWNWPGPDGIPGNGDDVYEEAYTDNYWIGFYFAGGMDPMNIRMEENPNFHDYFAALMADGQIAPGDHLIIVCQTGYRASFAGMEIKAMSNAYGWGMTVDVLYGGMLAWSDDWYLDDTSYCDNLPASPDKWDPAPGTDPSPDDYDPDYGWPSYGFPDDPGTVAGSGGNCDPDNAPGPAAKSKSSALVAPWAYDTARLALVAAPTIWNGTEPHVGVKAEWLGWAGHGDFNLSVARTTAVWATYADYLAGLLSVNFNVTNNAPFDVTPTPWVWGAPGPMNPNGSPLGYPLRMNYERYNGTSPCGGAPIPDGACEPVQQAFHGTAYNTMILQSTATAGVVPTGAGSNPAWPAMVGNVAALGTNGLTLQYTVPPGTPYFYTNLYAMATDVPDPTLGWPAGYNDPFHTPLMAPIFGTTAAPWPQTGMGWYGVSTYPSPCPMC